VPSIAVQTEFNLYRVPHLGIAELAQPLAAEHARRRGEATWGRKHAAAQGTYFASTRVLSKILLWCHSVPVHTIDIQQQLVSSSLLTVC
jgi:hypothetical protein